jgi:hypothetical protein
LAIIAEQFGAPVTLLGAGSVPIGISVRGEVALLPRIIAACECESIAGKSANAACKGSKRGRKEEHKQRIKQESKQASKKARKEESKNESKS